MALTMLTETCHDYSNATHEDESSVSATATVSNSRNLIRANGDQSRPFNDLFSIAMVRNSFDPATLQYPMINII